MRSPATRPSAAVRASPRQKRLITAAMPAAVAIAKGSGALGHRPAGRPDRDQQRRALDEHDEARCPGLVGQERGEEEGDEDRREHGPVAVACPHSLDPFEVRRAGRGDDRSWPQVRPAGACGPHRPARVKRPAVSSVRYDAGNVVLVEARRPLSERRRTMRWREVRRAVRARPAVSIAPDYAEPLCAWRLWEVADVEASPRAA